MFPSESIYVRSRSKTTCPKFLNLPSAAKLPGGVTNRKSKIIKFTTSNHTIESILDYVHYDLWGPARVQTMGGSRYFMSMVDDFSWKVWVYLPKSKYEDVHVFKMEKHGWKSDWDKSKEAQN